MIRSAEHVFENHFIQTWLNDMYDNVSPCTGRLRVAEASTIQQVFFTPVSHSPSTAFARKYGPYFPDYPDFCVIDVIMKALTHYNRDTVDAHIDDPLGNRPQELFILSGSLNVTKNKILSSGKNLAAPCDTRDMPWGDVLMLMRRYQTAMQYLNLDVVADVFRRNVIRVRKVLADLGNDPDLGEQRPDRYFHSRERKDGWERAFGCWVDCFLYYKEFRMTAWFAAEGTDLLDKVSNDNILLEEGDERRRLVLEFVEGLVSEGGLLDWEKMKFSEKYRIRHPPPVLRRDSRPML